MASQASEGKWEESLSHIAVHTPIQVPRCPDSNSSVFKGWPVAAPFDVFPQGAPAIYRSIPQFPTPGSAPYCDNTAKWQPNWEVARDSRTWQEMARPQPQIVPGLDILRPPESGDEKDDVDVEMTSAFVPPIKKEDLPPSPDTPEQEKPMEEQETVAEEEEKKEEMVEVETVEEERHEDAAPAGGLTISSSSADMDAHPSAFSAPTLIHSDTSPSGPSGPSSNESAGFSRPPGLGPPSSVPASQNTFVCTLCGFSCNSKFHYNSHMNTHGDHQCSMCDYTSRTEGRLRKHMRESHTIEQQLAAGLELSPARPSPPLPATPAKEMSIPTSLADIIDVTSLSDVSSLPPPLLPPNLMGLMSASGMPTALEQIRAMSEQKQPLFSDSLTDIGGPISGGIKKEERRSGKQKVYKCKQCPHISATKEEQWAHARTHIPPDKQMGCNKCNFVTEYKHHLEYHIRNHLGSKPFQCKKCSYTCVNKSMLNSHMKSHTNIYQFRCRDCTYATKYCHSLKLHLKKYGHTRRQDVPGEENNTDSPTQVMMDTPTTMANFSFEDQSSMQTAVSLPQMVSSQGLSYASQMLLRQHQLDMNSIMGLNLPAFNCAVCDFSTRNQDELVRHNMGHLLASQSMYQPLALQPPVIAQNHEQEHNPDDDDTTSPDASHSNASTGSPSGSGKCSSDEEGLRRKKKTSKIEEISLRLLEKTSPPIEETKTEPGEEAVVPMEEATPMEGNGEMTVLQQAYLAFAMQAKHAEWKFQCSHCKMAFQDHALHQIHMGYHGYDHVFQCNRCGHASPDALGFNLHLLQASHT